MRTRCLRNSTALDLHQGTGLGRCTCHTRTTTTKRISSTRARHRRGTQASRTVVVVVVVAVAVAVAATHAATRSTRLASWQPATRVGTRQGGKRSTHSTHSTNDSTHSHPVVVLAAWGALQGRTLL